MPVHGDRLNRFVNPKNDEVPMRNVTYPYQFRFAEVTYCENLASGFGYSPAVVICNGLMVTTNLHWFSRPFCVMYNMLPIALQ